jgi:predicted transcriptional regulator of viral defense system
MPKTVFIQTPARKKRNVMEIFGVSYRIVRIKEEKFFGLRKERIEEMPASITDREKTVIDCLDKPHYSGGVIEVAKALKHENLDYQKLSDYARKIGNSAVIRRLGYLCESMKIPIDLPLPVSKKYLLLDPSMPPKGPNNPRWRLAVNLDTTFTEALE